MRPSLPQLRFLAIGASARATTFSTIKPINISQAKRATPTNARTMTMRRIQRPWRLLNIAGSISQQSQARFQCKKS
jgi:hypothetical protein